MFRAMFLAIAAMISLSTQADAQWATVCRGQKPGVCQYWYTAGYTFIGCGSPEAFGASMCDAHDGKRPRYRVVLRDTHSGNRCGYNLYDIYCERLNFFGLDLFDLSPAASQKPTQRGRKRGS